MRTYVRAIPPGSHPIDLGKGRPLAVELPQTAVLHTTSARQELQLGMTSRCAR